MKNLKNGSKIHKTQILTKDMQTKIKGGNESDSADIIITDITEGV